MYGNIFGPSSVQLHNLNLVLEQIREKGPVSRADIARELGCSKSTVTKIVGQLVDFRLVREIGKGSPATGRKSILLEFNANAYFVVAVDLRPGHFNLAIVDLSGGIECQLELGEGGFGPELLVPRVIAGIKALIRKSKINRKNIEAVGIMVSGITDSEQGLVRYSAVLGWDTPVTLGPPVSRATGLPVFIENDVNSLALAESWIGCGQDSDSLAYIYLDEKVGGAYIHDGYISQGADFAFAEFGKLLIAGERGPEQLETRLALPDLMRRFGSVVRRKRSGAGASAAGFDFFLDYDSHKKEEVIGFLVLELSQVVTTIVAILNPRIIVLHCFSAGEADFIERLTCEAHRFLPRLPARTVRIVPATLYGQREIVGAAAVAISNTRFKFVVQG